MLDGGTAVVAAVDRRATGRFVPGAAPASPLVDEVVGAARALPGRTTAARCRTARPRSTARALRRTPASWGSAPAPRPRRSRVGRDARGGRLPISRQRDARLRARRPRPPRRAGRPRLGRRRRRRRLRRRHRLRAPRRPTADVQPLRCPRPSSWSCSRPGTPQLDRRPRAAPSRRSRRAIPRRTAQRLAAIAAPPTRFMPRLRAATPGAVVDDGRAARTSRWRRWATTRTCRSSRPPSRAPRARRAELGGAAKPSGAGGGDVGVAFLTDRGAAATFRAARAPPRGSKSLTYKDRRARPPPRAVRSSKGITMSKPELSHPRLLPPARRRAAPGCCACAPTCRSRTCDAGRRRHRHGAPPIAWSRTRSASTRCRWASGSTSGQRPRLPGADGRRGAVGDRGGVERRAHGARGRRLHRRRRRSGHDRADRDRRRRRSGRRRKAPHRGGARRAAGAGARRPCPASPSAAAARARWRCARHPGRA